LHWASSKGHLDVARMLVERGADVSARAKDGWTPLHCASYHRHVDVTRMLVEHGADASAQTRDGRTPLQLVVRQESTSSKGHVNVTRMLMGCGPDGLPLITNFNIERQYSMHLEGTSEGLI
jgi:ankyrin repeat protein